MKRRALSILIALSLASVACKGEDKTKEPLGDSPTTETTAEPGKDAEPTKVATASPAAALCEDPCLLLTEHKLKDLAGKGYCKLCGEADKEACTAPNPFAGDSCDQADYQRNCIYAANGYKFKKKKWREQFGKTDWYKEKDDFSESELTILETSNIRALRHRTSICRGKALGPVSPKDIELVRKFFTRKEAKKLKLPKRLYIDGSKASEADFREFLETEGLFILKKYTPIVYTEWGPGGSFDKSQFRALSVNTGAPSPDCKATGEGEECEGFEWLEVLIDNEGVITALGLGAAACPFAYVAAGESDFRFVGEVLPNRSRRSLETSHRLALAKEDTCAEVVRIQLREEKAELSFIDAVTLEVGDVRLSPGECANPTGKACQNDGRYRRIAQGEVAEFTFLIPPTLRCQPARLVTNGYYEVLGDNR